MASPSTAAEVAAAAFAPGARYVAPEAAAAATARLVALEAAVIAAGAGGGRERWVVLLAALAALVTRGWLSFAVAVPVPGAAAPVLTRSFTHAAAAAATEETKATSSLPPVKDNSSTTAAAAAPVSEHEVNTLFPSFVWSPSFAGVTVLLLRHVHLIVFLLLVLFWFAVAAWCPVHLLPLLLLPAYVRRRILQDVHEAKAVLSRVKKQQQQRQCMQAKKQKRQQESQEIMRELQEPGKKQLQQEQQPRQTRQRRLQQHEATTPATQQEDTEEKKKITEMHSSQQLQWKQEKLKETEINERQEAQTAQETLRVTRNRSMGFLHASLASALGLYCLLFDETLKADRMQSSTLLSTLDGLLLTSYFTWDMTAILLHWRHDSGQWLLHCVVSLLAIAHPLTATTGEPCMSYYAVALSLFELSTPFLALRYFYLKASSPRRAAAAAGAAAAAREVRKAGAAGWKKAAATEEAAVSPREGATDTAATAEEAGAAAGRGGVTIAPSQRAEESERNDEGVEMQLLMSASTGSFPTSRVFSSVPGEISSCPAAESSAAAAATAGPTVTAGATAAAKEKEPKTAAKGEAGLTRTDPAAEGAAGGRGEAEEKTSSARQQHPSLLVRSYETCLSVGFALTFFFVRIVWGNFFLFPEIYAQVLSPAGGGLLPVRRVFFLCAMPVFAALNCFWMILLIRVILSPSCALKK